MASADAASLHAAWLRICDRLKAEVGDVEYQSWIQRITLGPLDDDEITLYLPERFLRDWVRTQYGQRLQTLWREETPHVQHVELKIDKKAQRAPMSNGSHAPSSKSSHDIAAFAREDAAALDAEKETSPTAASPSVDVRNDLAVP